MSCGADLSVSPESTEFQRILDDISSDPQNILKYQNDKQYQQILMKNLPMMMNNNNSSKAEAVNCDPEEEKLKGNEKFKSKDYSGALFHYNRAIELDKENYIYYSNKASALLMMKNYSDAMEAVLLAIEKGQMKGAQNEFLAKCYVKLANVATGCGQDKGACAALEESLRLHEDKTVRGMLNNLKSRITD